MALCFYTLLPETLYCGCHKHVRFQQHYCSAIDKVLVTAAASQQLKQERQVEGDDC